MPEQIPAILTASAGDTGKFADNISNSDDRYQPPQDTGAPALPAAGTDSRLDETLGKIQSTLGEHKGKLAIGVAATLGLMIFYKWREKNLAKEDPQEYARLQRIKSSVLADEPAEAITDTAPPQRTGDE